MGRTPGTWGAEAGARTRDLEVIPKFPPCEEGLDSGAHCVHRMGEWALVLWGKRSEGSQALLILSALGVDRRDSPLWLQQSVQTVVMSSAYSPALPGMWTRHRMCTQKRAQAHLRNVGVPHAAGQGLVPGHTALWGQVCTVTTRSSDRLRAATSV